MCYIDILIECISLSEMRKKGVNSRSPYAKAAFFNALHVPGVFLINVLIRTSASGLCRSPDPRHLSVPDCVNNLEVSPFGLPFDG